jgi:hypothetical protein
MRLLMLLFIMPAIAAAQAGPPVADTYYWVSETTGDVVLSRSYDLGDSVADRVLVTAKMQGLDTSTEIMARSIALDEINSKVYWSVYQNTNPIVSKVFRMNLDGTGFEQLFVIEGVVSGLQIDGNGGSLYWVQSHATTFFSGLMRSNLDGSSVESIFDSFDLTGFGLADHLLFWDLVFDVGRQQAWFFVRTVEDVPLRDARIVIFDLNAATLTVEENFEEFTFEDIEFNFDLLFFNVPTLAFNPANGWYNIGYSRNQMGWGRAGQGFDFNGDVALLGWLSELHIVPGANTFTIFETYMVHHPNTNDRAFVTHRRAEEFQARVENHVIGTMIPYTGELLSLDINTLQDDFNTLVTKSGYPPDIDGDGMPESVSLALFKAAYEQNGEPYAAPMRNGYQENLVLFASESDSPDLPPQRGAVAALLLLGDEIKAALINFLHTRGIILNLDYTSLNTSDVSRATNQPLSGTGDLDGDGVSNRNEYLNTIASGGTIDDFILAALDPAKDGSDPPLPPAPGGGGGGGGTCIIANITAGMPLAEELGNIRSFRDSALLTNPVGAALSDAYYRISAWWLANN